MAAKLLTGKEVAQKMDQDIQKDVQELKAKGINPALRIMIVGEAQDSVYYANSAKKMAEKNGILCEIEQLAGTMSQDDFVNILKQRNADKNIHGIIVMRPFPKQISEDVVKHILAPEKDVDCFNPVNAGKIMAGDMTGFPPATPQAVMEMLRFYEIPMSRQGSRGHRPLHGRRQTHVHAAPGRERHGHGLPFEDQGPARRVQAGGYRGCRHRQGKDDHGRITSRRAPRSWMWASILRATNSSAM